MPLLPIETNDFRIGLHQNLYSGLVLVGPEALYFILAPGTELMPDDAELLSPPDPESRHPSMVPFSSLPPEIQSDPACAGILGDQQVCLLPRSSSPRIGTHFMNGVTLQTSAGTWRISIMPNPTSQAGKALREMGWQVGDSSPRLSYLILILVSLYAGWGLSELHFLAIPLALAGLYLWVRGLRTYLYWTMLWMGLVMGGVCYANLTLPDYQPEPESVDLAKLEDGTVRAPANMRLSGPIDCVEGLGLIEKGKNDIMVGCAFPILSSKHPYYNRYGKDRPPKDPKAFPIYLYWYGPIHSSGHEIVEGIVCELVPSDRKPDVLAQNGIKPRYVFLVNGFDLDPPAGNQGISRNNAQNFVVACLLVTIGGPLFIGSLLRRPSASPAPWRGA